jgi:hypothetical protein
MRLGASLVKPRLFNLQRLAVRAFSSARDQARACLQAAPGPSSVPPVATAEAPGSTADSSGAGSSAASQAPHILRKGARAVFEMPDIKDSIELTEEEAALFKELLDATKQVPAGLKPCCSRLAVGALPIAP